MKFTNEQLYFIGGLAVLIVGFLIRQWFTKFINKKFDDLNEFQVQGRKEREYDYYLTLKGQKVIADNLHELNYAVINGHHNGGLEEASIETDKFRVLVDENIAKKAARWNIKIDN